MAIVKCAIYFVQFLYRVPKREKMTLTVKTQSFYLIIEMFGYLYHNPYTDNLSRINYVLFICKN